MLGNIGSSGLEGIVLLDDELLIGHVDEEVVVRHRSRGGSVHSYGGGDALQ